MLFPVKEYNRIIRHSFDLSFQFRLILSLITEYVGSLYIAIDKLAMSTIFLY